MCLTGIQCGRQNLGHSNIRILGLSFDAGVSRGQPIDIKKYKCSILLISIFLVELRQILGQALITIPMFIVVRHCQVISFKRELESNNRSFRLFRTHYYI